ncbi:MAG: hypothetical protein IJ867_00810 [Clostridia bacterium]|nr:hypothetical protein [Clostridia bacterium]
MELKTKYQYTYFIHPYFVDENKYNKYILKLLKDKRCEFKIFEKEKDMNIYNYFLPNFRNYIFPTFGLRGEDLKNFDLLKPEAKSKIISEQTVACFSYHLAEQVKGKVDNHDGIFFNIEKIEIICFNTGICFFVMKTNLEGTNNFSDILNFNYKFKDIYSELNSLKNFENIRIQTDTFKDVKDILELIEQITGINRKKKSNQKEILTDRFYTFAYACLESEFWNDRNKLENYLTEFYRFANVLPSNHQADFNQEKNTIMIDKLKYYRIAVTKQASNILCSGMDTYNFTKLPYEYENEYFYTYIITLYQKIFLMRLDANFKEYEKIKKLRAEFLKFTKQIWEKEITLSDSGSSYYSALKEALELEDLYAESKNKYEIIYKDLNIEKNNKYYIVLLILLVLSLCLNLMNILLLTYYLK